MKLEDNTIQISNRLLAGQTYALLDEVNPKIIHHVILENENLKRRLELSNGFLNMMREQMNRFTAVFPEDLLVPLVGGSCAAFESLGFPEASDL